MHLLMRADSRLSISARHGLAVLVHDVGIRLLVLLPHLGCIHLGLLIREGQVFAKEGLLLAR
jgi:hypothetical protein